MQKRKRFNKSILVKVVTLLLVFMMSIILVPTSTKAAPYGFGNGTTMQEIQQAINAQLKSLNRVGIRKYSTQEAVFFNMKTVLTNATWVDALQGIKVEEKKGNSIISYPAEVIDYQNEKLLKLVIDFNEFFGSDSDKYTKVTLNKSGADQQMLDYRLLTNDMQNYITAYLDNVLGEDSNTDAILSKHKKELRYIYQICTTPTDVMNRFNGLMPVEDNARMYSYVTRSTLDKILENPKYKELLQKAREVTDKDISAISSGEPNNADDLVKLFLNDFKKEDDKNTFSEISDLYYLYFAGSAVYEPFVSKAGDDSFKLAINKLTNGKGTAPTPHLKTYETAKKYIKPLYKMSTNKEGEPTGEATEITLQQFAQSVLEEDNSGVLMLPKGKLARGKDDNSYYYYMTNDLIYDPKDESNENKDSNGKEVETNGKASGSLDRTNLSEPVFRWGPRDNQSDGISFRTKTRDLGGVVMANILESVTDLSKFSPDSSLLYMNVFGDIILEDGTIVLPGAANPAFFKEGSKYYPYTIAFMKFYPPMSASNTFKITDKKSENKYVLSADLQADDLEGDDDVDVSGTVFDAKNDRDISIKRAYEGNKTKYTTDRIMSSHKIQADFYDLDDSSQSILTFKKYKFVGNNFLDKLSLNKLANSIETSLRGMAIMTKGTDTLSTGNVGLFTQSPSSLDTEQLAMIVKNYYRMIMSDDNGESSDTPSPRFNKDVLGGNVIMEVLNGLTSAKSFADYKAQEYSSLVEDSPNRFKVFMKGLLQDFVSNLLSIRGVVGIENAYQSPVLGTVVSYGRAFMYFIIVAIIAGLIFKFMRQRFDFLQTILLSILTLGVCWAFITIIPVYIPTAINGAVDLFTANKSDDLGYMTLMMRMEDYGSTYNNETDDNGNEMVNTTTINLFRLKKEDMQDISNQLNISMEVMLKGEPIVLDSEAGIYIEGDMLKCSLDRLFINNPIYSSYENVNGIKMYTIHSDKMISSMFDNYSPYHLVVDALVEKLNGFNATFPATRDTINYGGLQKDSFTMQNYITSAPFLKPDNSELIDAEYGPEVTQIAKEYMGDFNDTFGLKKLFNSLPDAAKDSLWYRTMEQNGRFDEAQLDRILTKTTYNTKNFLINNYDRLSYMSDENIIKVTALYETIAMTRQFGTFGNELYPMFINSEEFTLGDVLKSTYVNDRAKFRYSKLDIIDYMVNNFGVIWAFIFSVSVLVSFLILNITKYVIPILYILLGILLLMKYITGSNSKLLIHGYIRGTLLIFFGYFLHCLGLIFASRLITNSFGIVLPLIINATLLEMMIRFILSVFKNPTDLGGKFTFSSITPWIASKIGLTDAIINVTNAVNGVGNGMSSMNSRMADRYRRYRDDYAYDIYTGQEGALDRVMKEQEKTRTSRQYDIDSVRQDTKVHKIRKRNPHNDAFSKYRD